MAIFQFITKCQIGKGKRKHDFFSFETFEHGGDMNMTMFVGYLTTKGVKVPTVFERGKSAQWDMNCFQKFENHITFENLVDNRNGRSYTIQRLIT